jgi:hypothetical protein
MPGVSHVKLDPFGEREIPHTRVLDEEVLRSRRQQQPGDFLEPLHRMPEPMLGYGPIDMGSGDRP